MVTIITGDIIKSRAMADPSKWLEPLKHALSHLQPDFSLWEIYRGDSFQMELHDNQKGFEAVTYIKACVKMTKGLDVRLAIGIGDKSFSAERITQSNGEAFQFSGDTLENLKKEKLNLKIKTRSAETDNELNLYFKLALIAMDNWTVNSAEIVKLSLENPKARQAELGEMIQINQTAVSHRQKRAYMDHIKELNQMYIHKINRLQ